MRTREEKIKADSRNSVINRRENSPGFSQLVLSVFHGADLLGRGFEEENFCVVRAGEIDLGFDVRKLRLLPGRFDGIIAGSPCQEYSLLNRNRRHAPQTICDCYGCQMMSEYARLVAEGKPLWFLHENVPTVPDLKIEGYTIQRFNLNARECGVQQNRLRSFQFGSADGRQLVLHRDESQTDFQRCVTPSEATKGKSRRRLTKFYELQGVNEDIQFPYFKRSEIYKVIGQGVPVPMARLNARAIRESATADFLSTSHKLCICGCGRIVTGWKKQANAACRKRMQMKRERALVNESGKITI